MVRASDPEADDGLQSRERSGGDGCEQTDGFVGRAFDMMNEKARRRVNDQPRAARTKVM